MRAAIMRSISLSALFPCKSAQNNDVINQRQRVSCNRAFLKNLLAINVEFSTLGPSCTHNYDILS